MQNSEIEGPSPDDRKARSLGSSQFRLRFIFMLLGVCAVFFGLLALHMGYGPHPSDRTWLWLGYSEGLRAFSIFLLFASPVSFIVAAYCFIRYPPRPWSLIAFFVYYGYWMVTIFYDPMSALSTSSFELGFLIMCFLSGLVTVEVSFRCAWRQHFIGVASPIMFSLLYVIMVNAIGSNSV